MVIVLSALQMWVTARSFQPRGVTARWAGSRATPGAGAVIDVTAGVRAQPTTVVVRTSVQIVIVRSELIVVRLLVRVVLPL
jgi:hypothetical protein